MLKRLCLLLICLLFAVPAVAEAEEIPTLPEPFVLTGLPADTRFTVYTGPGKVYYVANAGKAKVSTNEPILCYGRVDDEWLMISYETNDENSRIGYISLAAYPELMPACQTLDCADLRISVNHAFITDDPFGGGQVFGTLAGDITVLAWTATGNWAYIEGRLTEYSAPARGFVQGRKLNLDQVALDMPERANVLSHVRFQERRELNMPEDALFDGMAVYPLVDGSYLIAYHCQGSDKLWMRVVSSTGRKLFAKSVPELYLSQITLTDTGFICQTFDNPEIDSGMQYTYTCKGSKWTGKKVGWVEEADRFYSDNTADFTVRRYLFCEGAVFPITVSSHATGAQAQHRMTSYKYSDQPFLYELESQLLLCGGDETGAYTLRIFGDDAAERQRIPMPEGMPAPQQITSVVHDEGAVYFYAGSGSSWQRWRLDRRTMSFDPEPLTITVPADCTLTAVAATVPYHLVLMDTGYTAMLCDVTTRGELMKVTTLNSRAVWVGGTETGCVLLLPDRDGEFVLEYYEVN